MRYPIALVGAALLASCSGSKDQPAANVTQAEPAPVPPTSPPTPLAGGAGLTGQVSGLTSAVSGLNIRVTDMGKVIDMPSDALFEFDRADLTPDAAVQLAKAAEVIRAGPPGAIRIVGHTDSKGDDGYNQKLSEARARTVADWFGQQVGVRQRSFEVSGMGEKQPIAPNQAAGGQDDPVGRAKNRRVEVIVPKG